MVPAPSCSNSRGHSEQTEVNWLCYKAGLTLLCSYNTNIIPLVDKHIQTTLGAQTALDFTGGAYPCCPALQDASHFHKVQPNSSSSSDSSSGSKSNHFLSPSVRLILLFSFYWHTRFGRGAHSASLPSGTPFLYDITLLKRLSIALQKLVSSSPISYRMCPLLP